MAKSKITYDSALIKVMSLFETATHTELKDCFIARDTVYFVVDAENVGKAIGRQGKNAKMLENLLKKRIRIIEYSIDLATFIKNLIHPLTAKQIEISGGKVTITGQDTKTKALLIGRDSANINCYKDIIKRYFEIDEIKVV